jgi:flagellar capping protein FliD
MATSSVSSTTTSTAAEIQQANKAAAQRLLSSLNAGSGVDVAALAQNLVDAERMPKENAINAKIAKNESKVSGLSAVMFMMNELKANLAGLKDRSSYNTLAVANSSSTALNVTTSTSASAGSYAVNINSLAQPQRTMSAGYSAKTSLINGGVLFDMVLSSSRAGVSEGSTTNTAPAHATIAGASFGTTATTTDFSQFNITVGGTSYSLTPAPASADTTALATDLQTQLRTLDSTMSVAVVDGDLVATSSDYTKRISQMSLTLDAAATGGSVGTPDISPVATYTSSISGLSFGTTPSLTDFKNFSVTVDGETFNMRPLPETADLSALAEDLTSQLQALDGSDDLTVTLSGTNTLVVRSSVTTRKVYDPTLSTSTTIKLDSGADAGTPLATGSSITGIAFGTTPSTNDFKSFSIKIGDNVRSIIPVPGSPTVASLAEDLQKRLRILEGSDDISVTANGDDIAITSASGKTITQAVLSKQTYTDTPEGVVQAINQAGSGVTAELVNDGSSGTPYKIMINGESGASESFSMASSNSGLMSFTTSASNQATDATLTVNGISYARKTNAFSDVITGVNMDLRSTTTTPATIVLSQDSSAIKEKLQAFVVAYNDFSSIVSETTNPKSELDTYGKTLVGDSTVKMVRQQMRNLLFGQSTTPGTAITSLGDLGFKTDNKGVLSLDEFKLDTALKDNYSDVIKAMTGNQNNLSERFTQPSGIAADAFRRLTSLVSRTGPLVTKSENANTENDKYSADLEKIKARMETLLERYTRQFAMMESLVGGVNAQKTSLKSTFDGMMSMYTNK